MLADQLEFFMSGLVSARFFDDQFQANTHQKMKQGSDFLSVLNPEFK